MDISKKIASLETGLVHLLLSFNVQFYQSRDTFYQFLWIFRAWYKDFHFQNLILLYLKKKFDVGISLNETYNWGKRWDVTQRMNMCHQQIRFTLFFSGLTRLYCNAQALLEETNSLINRITLDQLNGAIGYAKYFRYGSCHLD